MCKFLDIQVLGYTLNIHKLEWQCNESRIAGEQDGNEDNYEEQGRKMKIKILYKMGGRKDGNGNSRVEVSKFRFLCF